MRRNYTQEKAAIIKKIVEEWYEPGRQDRCKTWVYRHKIFPLYPMSERTFFRYLAVKEKEGSI